MPFAKLPVELRLDPRWQEIPERHRSDAKAVYVDAVMYSAEMLTDGVVSRAVLVTFGESNGVRSVQKVVQEIARIGLLQELRRGVFLIKEWHVYHSSREEVERQRMAAAERKRRSRGQLSLDMSHPMSHRDDTVLSHSDEAVTRARARAGGQPQQQRQTDLQAVDEGANGATREPDQPAAADTQVEATAPSRIAAVIQTMPGHDTGTLSQIEPLAIQLPAATFEEIATTVQQRRNVTNPIGLLKTLLERELRTRQRTAIANAAQRTASDLVNTDSPVERMKRDHPDRYIESMARVLDEHALEAYLANYVTDEDERIALRDRYHDARHATA
jgi:hypothetical protein